jgi:hypothetical protein
MTQNYIRSKRKVMFERLCANTAIALTMFLIGRFIAHFIGI